MDVGATVDAIRRELCEWDAETLRAEAVAPKSPSIGVAAEMLRPLYTAVANSKMIDPSTIDADRWSTGECVGGERTTTFAMVRGGVADGRVAHVVNVRDAEDIVAPMCVMQTAKAGGDEGMSPKVFDAYFCASDMRCVYVIVAEDVRGSPLPAWMDGRGDDEVRNVVRQIRAMVARLHSQGIMYTPSMSDFVVDETGRPLLVTGLCRCKYLPSYVRALASRVDFAAISEELEKSFGDGRAPSDLEIAGALASRLVDRGVVS